MFEQHAHGYFQPVGASCALAGTVRNDTDIAAKAAQANKERFFKLSMSLSFLARSSRRIILPLAVSFEA
jgi:hypothetical protein